MKSLKVLYVEDEEMIRRAFASLLTYRVGSLFTARDGREGLQAFVACRPDLVVTDICMPVMDGLEMASRIRSLSRDVPIVFLTGSPERLVEFAGYDPAIDQVVAKPVSFAVFFRVLEGYAKDMRTGDICAI